MKIIQLVVTALQCLSVVHAEDNIPGEHPKWEFPGAVTCFAYPSGPHYEDELTFTTDDLKSIVSGQIGRRHNTKQYTGAKYIRGRMLSIDFNVVFGPKRARNSIIFLQARLINGVRTSFRAGPALTAQGPCAKTVA